MHFTDFIALEPIKRNLNPMSFLNHLTLSDFAGTAWNSIMITPPTIAGFATAFAICNLAHSFLPKKREGLSRLFSLSARAVAFVIGSNVSYMVAARIPLISFSADKVIRLAPLTVSIPGAILGWYGSRALCVLGSLGAIAGGLYGAQREGTQNRRSSNFHRG